MLALKSCNILSMIVFLLWVCESSFILFLSFSHSFTHFCMLNRMNWMDNNWFRNVPLKHGTNLKNTHSIRSIDSKMKVIDGKWKKRAAKFYSMVAYWWSNATYFAFIWFIFVMNCLEFVLKGTHLAENWNFLHSNINGGSEGTETGTHSRTNKHIHLKAHSHKWCGDGWPSTRCWKIEHKKNVQNQERNGRKKQRQLSKPSELSNFYFIHTQHEVNNPYT